MCLDKAVLGQGGGGYSCPPSCLQMLSTLYFGGVFAQCMHSTNYYIVYPGNTPENHPPTEACTIDSKQHRGCRIQDPGARGSRWWKTADFSHSRHCAPFGSFQTPGPSGGGVEGDLCHGP